MAIPESDPAKIADLGVFGGLVERTSRDAHHRRPEVDNDGGPPVATADHASGGPIPAACVSSTADPDALGRIRSRFGASFSDLRTNRFDHGGPHPSPICFIRPTRSYESRSSVISPLS